MHYYVRLFDSIGLAVTQCPEACRKLATPLRAAMLKTQANHAAAKEAVQASSRN